MSILINRMRLMAQLVQLQENIPQYTGQNKLTINATVNIIGYNWFLIKNSLHFNQLYSPFHSLLPPCSCVAIVFRKFLCLNRLSPFFVLQ